MSTAINRMKQQLRTVRRCGIRAKDIVAIPLTGGDYLDRYLKTQIGTKDARNCLESVHRLGLSLPSREGQAFNIDED